MASSDIELTLSLDETGADDERISDLIQWLQQDLLELGVEKAGKPVSGSAPVGSKGDPITLGALVLVVAPVLLPKLIEFLSSWTTKSDHRKVRIKTPSGVEVEFTSKQPLDQAGVLALIKKLNKIK